MKEYKNKTIMCERISELPVFLNANELFLDVETTSFDDKKEGFSPYTGAKILGIAVTADDCEYAYYIPIRHRDVSWNLPLEPVLKWLKETLGTCKEWVNHNIKFDAHFCAEDGAIFGGRLVDTLVLSKLIDSDRRTYNLTDLTKDFLRQDITPFEDELKKYVGKSKDYGIIPADIMAPYAGQDVLSTRELYHYMLRARPDSLEKVWETEILLTPVLWDIEREGMHVDSKELLSRQFIHSYQLVKIEEEIQNDVGWPIRPHTNEDCQELLCNQHGLPILGHTENHEPSFDKNILAQYLELPTVVCNLKLRALIEKCLKYRKINTLVNMFIAPYIEFSVNETLHPDYNQSVRTGRMSCRRPNAQQLDKEAKALIHPPKDMAILSYDYSQIEFRLIVHYIENPAAILAYNENPDTDFHDWTAKECGIPRKPAKNVNFGIGYGAGENKIVTMLSNVAELVMDLMSKIDEGIKDNKLQESQRHQIFQLLCRQRGKAIYDKYHATLPELRTTSRQAMYSARNRGYVFNAYGRRRHLTHDFAYRAFNSVIQSCAADIMKERAVAIAPRYNPRVKELGMRPFAIVHDEIAFYGSTEITQDPKVRYELAQILESPTIEFKVPIRVSCGWSDKNWAVASGDEGEVEIVRPT